MKRYALRMEDENLWRRMKSKCALEGIKIKDLIIRLLQSWVEGKIKI